MVAVFSGRRRTIIDPATGQRRTVGYRLIKGGSSVRLPILERVDFLSLNVMTIPLKIAPAYTKEGVPVSIDAVANVKLGSDDVMLMNAIERSLSMDQDQIRGVIFQTLEGHLRSILWALTVEQINADRQAFAQRLAAESTQELSRMGREIDVLTIQQISDPQGYLDALGQRRTAEVKRDAEAGKAERGARVRHAQALQQAAIAEAMAEAEVAAAQKDAKVRKARYQAGVQAERARAAQAAPLAEAEARKQVVVAEQQVELGRTEAGIAVQEMEARRREKELEATIPKGADVEKQAMEIRAEGEKVVSILRAEGERRATIVRAEAASRERELMGAGEGARIRQIGQAEAEAKEAFAQALQAELTAQAEGERARLLAEADGKRALAEALNQCGPVAPQLLMYQAFLVQLLKVVEAAARPLTQVERVVVFDSAAGSDGASALGRYANQLPLTVQQMIEGFSTLTGLDLTSAIRERLISLPAQTDRAGVDPPTESADGK